MSEHLIDRTGDLLGDYKTFSLHWGLPIAAMALAIFLGHPPKTLVWVSALIWMSVACLINARRCGRTHCYYTGPFFLFMTLPVTLHGFHILWLGPEGWKWLGIAVGAGGGGLWCLTEFLFGRYSTNPRNTSQA